MKKIISLVFIPLLLVSANTSAGIGDVKGKSTCTRVYSIDKGQHKSMPCTYEGRVGGSASYNISELKFKLSNGDKYNTIDNIRFKSDNKGNYLWKESYVYVNENVADILYLHPKTLKKIPESKLDNTENIKTLYCFKERDRAFCIPYSLVIYLD